MLEPYDAKASRTVPRRGGQGNLILLFDKVRNPAVLAFATKLRTDTEIPGLQMAPTASVIITHMELGKPHELPKPGRNLARGTNCSGGRGDSKKANACL